MNITILFPISTSNLRYNFWKPCMQSKLSLKYTRGKNIDHLSTLTLFSQSYFCEWKKFIGEIKNKTEQKEHYLFGVQLQCNHFLQFGHIIPGLEWACFCVSICSTGINKVQDHMLMVPRRLYSGAQQRVPASLPEGKFQRGTSAVRYADPLQSPLPSLCSTLGRPESPKLVDNTLVSVEVTRAGLEICILDSVNTEQTPQVDFSMVLSKTPRRQRLPCIMYHIRIGL